MAQHVHEEFEVGHHLDQAARTALMGVAQLVERLARSTAERDREAAQALRERLLQPAPTGGDEPLGATARGYLDAATGTGPARTAAAWAAAAGDVAADPGNAGAVTAAAQLNERAHRRHGLDLAATVANAWLCQLKPDPEGNLSRTHGLQFALSSLVGMRPRPALAVRGTDLVL